MVNRNTIKKIKKRLVANDKEFQCLKSKFFGANFDGEKDVDFEDGGTPEKKEKGDALNL